ncbi:hypothetical protein W690_00427, partial [Staphylococcus aureus VET0596R]
DPTQKIHFIEFYIYVQVGQSVLFFKYFKVKLHVNT